MAKKKGGKKKGSGKKKPAGKKSGSKRPPAKKKPQAKKEEVVEEAPVEEPRDEPPIEEVIEETIPEPEEIIPEPETAEPELSDAVAEVLGDSKNDKKKDNRKIPKKYKTALLKYQTDSLDTAELEDLMENASVKKIREGFRAFEEGLEKVQEIKIALEDMELAGLDNEVEELTQLLANPKNYEEAATKFEELKFKQKTSSIHDELNKMVLPAMKERVAEMKARLDAMEDLDAIEESMIELRRDYKEAYAEEGVMAHVASEGPASAKASPAAPKGKKTPMIVKDIFLLYKDGRFISHHTNRVVSKDQQKVLFADLKTGRNFLRSPKYIPQKLNVIPVAKRHILVQSGKFTVVIMITEGAVDPWTERIVTKVLNLMEKEDANELRAWNGEVASLKSSGKYMQALLFACMKLSKKGK